LRSRVTPFSGSTSVMVAGMPLESCTRSPTLSPLGARSAGRPGGGGGMGAGRGV
jgi:hypothetical protein